MLALSCTDLSLIPPSPHHAPLPTLPTHTLLFWKRARAGLAFGAHLGSDPTPASDDLLRIHGHKRKGSDLAISDRAGRSRYTEWNVGSLAKKYTGGAPRGSYHPSAGQPGAQDHRATIDSPNTQ